MRTYNVTNLTSEKIIKLMNDLDTMNIKTPNGYITMIGGLKNGILMKIELGKEYVCTKQGWIEVGGINDS